MHNNDDTEAWNCKLSAAWAAHLRQHNLRSTDTVVELGPGFSDKLARGLATLAFCGQIVLVEPNAAAGAAAETNYRRWLPQAEIIRIERPLPECGSLVNHTVDVLAANHILDDLLLHAALLPDARADLFAEMRPGADCTPSFLNAWQCLLAHPMRLEQLGEQIAEEFTHYITALQPRLVLLNQYPSWRHAQHGLCAIHTHAAALLPRLAARLATSGYETAVSPATEISPAGAWLTGKKARGPAAITEKQQ